jgi:HD-GYP domain-containing protein (c-di-GMP phosphodiesterase class II)
LNETRARLASLVLPEPAPDAFCTRLLELAQQVQRACETDSDAALASVLLSRWLPYSVRQCCNSAVICEVLWRQLEWPPEKRLPGLAAALTMNLSILQLQDTLYHQEQPLDHQQKSAILAHPRGAVGLLERLGVDDPVWLNAVAQHHEALDGSGYPARLSGDGIGTEARVLAMADKYCAMIAERGYRQGRPADAALRQMLVSHGTGLDTELAARLVRAVGIYPPGSAVELNNGEIGVVVKRTLDARHPVVRIVISADGRDLREFPKRLTSKVPFGVKAAVERSRLGRAFDPVPLWHDSMVASDP